MVSCSCQVNAIFDRVDCESINPINRIAHSTGRHPASQAGAPATARVVVPEHWHDHSGSDIRESARPRFVETMPAVSNNAPNQNKF